MKEKQSFIAGFLTGSIQTILGHPFDTIKVLMQTNKFTGYRYNTNLKGLYKGLSYPLITQSVVVSSLFGVFETAKSHGFDNFTAGGISGISTGLLLTPIELAKIKKQIGNKNVIKSIKNPMLGIIPTLYREIIGNSIYFGTYYCAKNNDIPIFISGGIAGVLCWTVSYPLDVIKSRIQSSECTTIKEAIVKKNFFKGLSPCLMRALVINSVGFWCYEKIISHL
jgi:solute carrier family 25 (mitochondrial carnitine/acylcarnitine transporter), member 20/29